MLIVAGADVDARDREGRSVAFFALEGPEARRCLALLLAAGCDTDAEPAPGRSLDQMSASLSIGCCDDVVQSERIRREARAIGQATGPGRAGGGSKFRI